MFRSYYHCYTYFTQQIAESHGQGPKPDPYDADTSDAANTRCKKLVEAGGVQALRKLSEGASDITLVAIAKCFRHICCDVSSRGLVVQQGGLNALINMASSTDKNIATEAVHAIAKVLVTTNPNMLTEAQRMGCVVSLMALCKEHDATNLQQFEALMALANLATTGDAVKRRIVTEKGITALHYLMFSEHELVRRAATEAMLNLLPHEDMVQHLRNKENTKLWLAFAGLREEDRPTALAASGAIAMAAFDEDVAQAILASNGIALLAEQLACGDSDIVHRAAVAVQQLTQHTSVADAVNGSAELRAAISEAVSTQPAGSLTAAALDKALQLMKTKQ
jgi:protein unc-45